MEVGTQTDTLTNKNIVVLNQKEKPMMRRRKIKSIKSISNATPDIKQQWRIWKGIDERNLLRNIEMNEDITDRLMEVFGTKQTDIEKALETFQKGRGVIIGTNYSKEQNDNRRVARRIGGDSVSAYQGGVESRRAYAGWEGADFDMLERVARNTGRPVEEVFPFSSINWGDAPAPRISMSEVVVSQLPRSQRPRVGARETRGLGGLVEGINLGGYNLRSTLRRYTNSIGGLTTNRPETTMSQASRASTQRQYGISGGLRTGDRLRRVL